MSIKGAGQKLYVGKESSNIITFWGNKKRINYDELSRIDYMYSSGIETGYLEFVKYGNNIIRFEFGIRANEKIAKTIALINEYNQELQINEYRPSDFKFYQHSLFAILVTFILGFPLGSIGLFLVWHYKKGTRMWRVFITVFAILFWSSWIIIPYIEYRLAMNDLNNAMNSYFEILDGLKWR
ncbi:hypothetical protein [Clostridium sp. HBUAS56010]|uniref:hypothetical protein n=1 Tax=Clostridium sp. HBUAS56010 TaxID=2571127 RepID=UPI0011787844|nr:hypothetical protein [Clostridium sp. HBUAS56010]